MYQTGKLRFFPSVSSVGSLVPRLRTFDRDVIGERLSPIGDLGSENVGNIALENGRGVGPAHRQNRETKSTEGGGDETEGVG